MAFLAYLLTLNNRITLKYSILRRGSLGNVNKNKTQNRKVKKNF